MRHHILPCLAACALVGCALPTERPRLGERWGLSENPTEGAKLVLGVPDTDDVRLMMTCRPHAGEVDLTIVGRRGDPAVVELHSGDVWKRYSGAGHDDEETIGGVDIDLKLPATDPVLARLADTGDLSIVFAARRIVLPNAFASAHDFLATCRA
jgi:hypothetical protein